MKVCMISKYPPIEGGVSSLAFWLAKALGKRGHEVHIVTNAWCVEPEFMEEFDVEDIDQYQPKNVKVHNIDPLARLEQIPSSKNYVERIASLAIDVVKEYSIDVIDSWYMIPYGISGFITKIVTKKPQILRHAGSDIDILLSNNSRAYRSLLVELLKNVDKIVTRPHMKEVFLSLGVGEDKMFFSKECIDVNEFTPYAKPLKLANYTNREINNPVITYVGKCAKNRGLIELLAAASKVKAELTLLFVTSGEYSKEFRNLIKSFKMEKKVIIINFIPPWRMPSLIKASSCLVFPETEFPATFRTPIVPREAWAVGKCTILSREIFNRYSFYNLQDEVNTLVVNPKNIREFKEKLEWVIKNPERVEEIGKEARKLSLQVEDFEGYIKNTEKLYEMIVHESKTF